MNKSSITVEDISIRTELKPGDVSFAVFEQAKLYHNEYGFGVSFESYMLEGMHEFIDNYNSDLDSVWICEHDGKIIGTLFLMHRENDAAQLRYFYIDSEYRGLGLGKKLMRLYMDFLKEKKYRSSYLWTTEGLDSAIYLYTRSGFSLTEKKPSTAFGKPLNELRFDFHF